MIAFFIWLIIYLFFYHHSPTVGWVVKKRSLRHSLALLRYGSNTDYSMVIGIIPCLAGRNASAKCLKILVLPMCNDLRLWVCICILSRNRLKLCFSVSSEDFPIQSITTPRSFAVAELLITLFSYLLHNHILYYCKPSDVQYTYLH